MFDEGRRNKLFCHITSVKTSFVGTRRGRTNYISVFLMDLAGNPWGFYDQEEKCIHCGKKLITLEKSNIIKKILIGVAYT